jgi:menaquinone-dependent protoporphyrinogen oxidase
MNILLLYGTTEGHTRKIAQYVAQRLDNVGHDVKTVEAIMLPASLEPGAYDVVIVAASVHVGHYQPRVVDFARKHHATLNAMTAAFISVSLAAAGQDDDDVQGVAQCVDAFSRATGWTPMHVHHAAGAFRFTQYDFFKTWAMKYIAWRKNVRVVAGQDLELTDWQALGRFIDDLAPSQMTKA